MGKSVLTHADHLMIITEPKGLNGLEAEHSVCVRLAAKFGVGKGRIYELRHGIHTPPCCLPQTGGVITPAMMRAATKRVNLFKKTNPAKPLAPTSDLPIVGFRMWNYALLSKGEPRLQSYNTHLGTWAPGEKYTATCANGSSHSVPSATECCGVHAYKRKSAADLLARSADGILGAVIMYGTVRENTLGYRAQFARPICFSVVPMPAIVIIGLTDIGELSKYALRVKRTEALAKEYQVPIVPYESMELYMSEFGQMLPVVNRGRAVS